MKDDNIDLQQQFSAAMKRNKEKLNMTTDEQRKFADAMKQPEFRSLLKDYMDEISDPKYRKEQEMYLEQLERDNQLPSEKQLVIPKPGFVAKAWKQKDSSKVFINVCHSEKIDQATFQIMDGTKDGKKGVQWSLPYTLGPQRFEKDKAGEAIPTFDCCFHTDALRRAVSDHRFKDLLTKTAIDGVSKVLVDKEKSMDEKLGEKFHIIRGMSYKSGDPVTMMISRPRSDIDTSSNANDEQSKVETKLDEHKTPKYTVVHRGKFEMTDHMLEKEKKLFRPKELVIKVELPILKSAKEVDLDVSTHVFKLRAPGYSEIKAKLPYPVLDAQGSAKFDKASKTLVVTLPVQPIPPSKPADCVEPRSCGEEQQNTDKADEIEDLADMQRDASPKNEPSPRSPKTVDQGQTDVFPHTNQPQDIKNERREKDIHSEHGRWISNDTEPLANDEFRTLREAAEKIAKEDKSHEDKVESSTKEGANYLAVKFDYKQTPVAVSIIVKISHIIKDSVKANWTNKLVSVSFECGTNKQMYALRVNLNGEISDCHFDVASNNMVVILKKCVSGMWKEPAITASDRLHMSCPMDASWKGANLPQESDESRIIVESMPPPSPVPFHNEIMYELD